MILRGLLILLMASVAQAQPALPLPPGAATEGVESGQPIRAVDAMNNTRTLVDAINELHRRQDELEDELADRDRRLAELEGFGLTQGTYHLAFHYDAATGRFSIQCTSEAPDAPAPCTEANPGYVVMPSARHGGLVRLKVDSDEHFFHDARAAAANQDLAGNSFNSERGRPWPARRPFFIYAVNRDDSSAGLRFGLTLHPAATRVPQFGVGGGLHVVGARREAANANEAVDFVFLWGDGDDRDDLETQYKTIPKPAQRIGSLEMEKEVIGGQDQWRIERWGPDQNDGGMPLGEWRVGLGRYPWNVSYVLPPGAAKGTGPSYFSAANGMAACVDSRIHYRVSLDGTVRVMTEVSGCTTMEGEDDLYLVPPFTGAAVQAANEERTRYLGTFHMDAGPGGDALVTVYFSAAGGRFKFLNWSAPNGNVEADILGQSFFQGNNSASWELSYRAFVD